MGHAGAIVSGSKGTAKAKAEALEAKGVRVGRTPTEVAEAAMALLGGSGASGSGANGSGANGSGGSGGDPGASGSGGSGGDPGASGTGGSGGDPATDAAADAAAANLGDDTESADLALDKETEEMLENEPSDDPTASS
jgi:hypothetical protein